MVRTATAADEAIDVDLDLSSLPLSGFGPFTQQGRRGTGRRMTGWV